MSGKNQMPNNEDVLSQLSNVIDPELGLNIVELGLIYDVIIREDVILVKMTLTTPGCPMHDSILEWTERQLQQSFPQYRIFIDLVWEPEWTPHKMSAEAKEKLDHMFG
jgi:metal-sulfur cluster biosynthetic enzyme